VILYARNGLMSATRTWFVLHAMGHRKLSLLDGGYERWLAENRPVENGPARQDSNRPARAPYQARPDTRKIAGLAEMRNALGDGGTRLVNALSREQFAGTGGAHYGRPGRIPGSVSVPARELVSPETGCLLPPETLRERFAAEGVMDAQRTIIYCGGGIAATIDAFVLEMLGHQDWAVYDNSLLEWSTIEELPMARD
jgi:thiosulfate/3-mercaptopyruvate sulfurtransferase